MVIGTRVVHCYRSQEIIVYHMGLLGWYKEIYPGGVRQRESAYTDSFTGNGLVCRSLATKHWSMRGNKAPLYAPSLIVIVIVYRVCSPVRRPEE